MASIDSETAQRILTFEDTLAQYFSSTTLQRKVQLSQNEIELVSFTDTFNNLTGTACREKFPIRKRDGRSSLSSY